MTDEGQTSDHVLEYLLMRKPIDKRCEQVALAGHVLELLANNMWLPNMTAAMTKKDILNGIATWLDEMSIVVTMDGDRRGRFLDYPDYTETHKEFEARDASSLLKTCKVLEGLPREHLIMFIRILTEDGASERTFAKVHELATTHYAGPKIRFLDSLPPYVPG